MGKWEWMFSVLTGWVLANFFNLFVFGLAVNWGDIAIVVAVCLIAVLTFPTVTPQEGK